ncbi:MAG TPA: Zn-dependent hydrolase [Candidatus Dormibacteraeota bacterium]
MLRVDGRRMLDDLRDLSAIGGRPDGGVDRVAGSPADLEARAWLGRRLEAAGMQARTDEVNNVFGRAARGSPPWLLTGSHTDTVPAGGRLDGAFGVIAALEAARTLVESRADAASNVEIVSFHDEEGVTGGGGLSGSRALLRGPHAAEIGAYLEIHIEQGPVLESEGLELGVVEGIVGIRRLDVVFEGEANHAGTTPYEARHDAGAAAGRLTSELRDLLRGIEATMVGNVGVIRFEPGSPNVVPGRASLVVEVRSLANRSLDRACEAVRVAAERAAAAGGCTVKVDPGLTIEPVRMDAGIVDTLVRVCERSGRPWKRMSSGAGHDAGAMATRVPAGMLFVPSHRGVSHSPLEHTDDALLVGGCQALLDGIVEVASGL